MASCPSALCSACGRSTVLRAFVLGMVLLYSAQAGAKASESVDTWLMAPVPLDSRPSVARVQSFVAALAAALGERSGGRAPQVGEAFLLEKIQSQHEADQRRVSRARGLCEEAQKLYFGGEFARSAAAFAECAALLRADLGSASQAQVRELHEALMLQGVAWFDSGSTDAAVDAFVDLLAMVPDVAPDPVLVPPGVAAFFEQARGKIRELGTGSVVIRSEPSGAAVAIDGVPRGLTPLEVSSLSAGNHVLRVESRAHTPAIHNIQVEAGRTLSHSARLSVHPIIAGMRQLREAAQNGVPLLAVREELDQLRAATGVQTVILTASALRGGQPLVVIRALGAGASLTAVAHLAKEGSMGEKAKSPGAAQAPRRAAFAASGADAALALEIAKFLLVPPVAGATHQVQHFPLAATPVAIDVRRALMGIGPDWGGEPLVLAATKPGLLSRWWVWAGVGALVAGAGGAFLLSRSTPATGRSGVRFVIGALP